MKLSEVKQRLDSWTASFICLPVCDLVSRTSVLTIEWSVIKT